MKTWMGMATALAVMVFISLGFNPAMAHRFNVALIIPATDTGAEQGRQFREGFMLATTERDGHPNEESDGHLGGLDVYVTIIEPQGDAGADADRIVSEGQINIVAAFGPEQTQSMIEGRLAGGNIVFVAPGQTPFSQTGSAPVAAFTAAFEGQYGSKPSADAAQGYNVARRIDVAVRAQGGVRETDDLRQSFSATQTGFAW